MSRAVLAGLLVLALLTGCEEPLGTDPTAALSEKIPTVATIRWDTVFDDAGEAYVEFGQGQAWDHRAPVSDLEDNHREALLLGMKADAAYRWRAVEVYDGVRYVSAPGNLHTGAAPPYLPRIEVTSSDGSQMADGYLVGSIVTIPCTAVILDGDGDYVWWHRIESDADHVFIPRVRRSRVGEWVILAADEQNVAPAGPNVSVNVQVLRIGLDGTPRTVHSVPTGHHDFAELPDGTVAMLEHDDRVIGGKHVRGDRIVEVDPDGVRRVVWSAWDHLVYDPDQTYGEPGTGWTHANALDYDHERDLYHVSLRNLDAILRVERATGEVLWQLGGEGGDFDDPQSDAPLFQRQHQFEIDGDRILVFDNSTVSHGQSRVVEYELDAGAGIAQRTWTYESDPSLYSMVLGDVARLPNDHVLVTWSTAGVVEEVDTDSQVVWKLQTQIGGGIGYVTWRNTLYSREIPRDEGTKRLGEF
jgi:Arylsulfotransferase (ASST)